MLYDKSVSELIACPRLKDEITIPDGIQTISPFAFYSCQNLRVINMPNSITMLGEAGFKVCIYNHRTTKTNQKYPSVNL